MKVWVTRDQVQPRDDTVIWNVVKGRPVSAGADFDYVGGFIKYASSAASFKQLFGFTPRKGTCRKYELSLKEIK